MGNSALLSRSLYLNTIFASDTILIWSMKRFAMPFVDCYVRIYYEFFKQMRKQHEY